MKKEFSNEELIVFLGKAGLGGYASGDGGYKKKENGFFEFDFQEGDFAYQDRFAGYFTSAGQEVIWYKEKLIWTQSYGGGMVLEYRDNEVFAKQTFQFVMKCLSQGEKIKEFQPRGPKNFAEGDYEYICKWAGDITEFKGDEQILYKGELVFTHHFFGGILEGK